MNPNFRNHHLGYTLVEMMVSMAIMATLAGIMTISYGAFRERAEKVACMGNLKTLHNAFATHVEDVGYWPQVSEDVNDAFKYYDTIIEAVTPYGGERLAWMCPTEARIGLVSTSREDFMGSYAPTMYDTVAGRPYEWQSQPWLIERVDNHGTGQLFVLPDSSIHAVGDLMKGR